MESPRAYGRRPFKVAVVHGGPGAVGEMAPVACRLASKRGILEPIQTATSLQGQVEELKSTLEHDGDPPITLIGFSWGAWLSLIVTASYPTLTKKLILIGSGPFEESYVSQLQQARLSRFTEEERTEYESILKSMEDPAVTEKNKLLERLGVLASRTDEYDPIEKEPHESALLSRTGDLYQSVWKDAAELRRTGKLLEFAQRIQCPVVAIHGDYDPHPAEGVRRPLSAVLKDFRFVMLKQCGHKPWIERWARKEFFRILEEELD
ncbi:MAG: alpha/beta hydrolase [Acidobacteriia bacterium]|nr:alpha/beta hydrolase [Terriglobia bacterium]